MNAIKDDRREEEDWDRYDDEFDDALPRRPRRQFLNMWSALLFALILGGAGFYIGIRVEKNQLSSTSSGGRTGLAALASRFGGAGATAAGGTSTTATGGTGTTAGGASTGAGTGAAGGGSGFAGRFGGFGGLGGGSGTIGSVSSVDGNTIYVQETSGNTVKVTLSSATKITKSQPVSKAKVNPGDTVIVTGVTNSKTGAVSATGVTDSGASSTGSGTTTGGSGSSGSGSAVSSLF